MATAHLEHIASILRIYDHDNGGPPDPYAWTCTIRWVDDRCVELMGVTNAITKPQLKAMRETFRKMGMTSYTYHRVRNGTMQRVTHKLDVNPEDGLA